MVYDVMFHFILAISIYLYVDKINIILLLLLFNCLPDCYYTTRGLFFSSSSLSCVFSCASQCATV